MTDKEKPLIHAWIWQSSLFLILLRNAFFLLAVDWKWTWGWVLIVLFWTFMTAHPLLLIKGNPKLLAERAKGMNAEGTKA